MIAQQITWLRAPELKLTLKNPFQNAKAEQDFRVNYGLFQPIDYFDDPSVAPMPYSWFLLHFNVEKRRSNLIYSKTGENQSAEELESIIECNFLSDGKD